MKKMPYTAIFFLIGSLAICGLPPFNGFISEYLIYLGMFKSLSGANLYQSIIVIGSLTGLALIGGLAIFCFTKAFGIIFLGGHRTAESANAVEVRKNMIYPQYIIVFFILLIGIVPALFVKPVFTMVSTIFKIGDVSIIRENSVTNMVQISIMGGIFIVSISAILIYRYFHLKTKQIETGPTWGCGYTAATIKHQYTETSLADNFVSLANPLLGVKKEMAEIHSDEIFPVKRKFETHSADFFKKIIIDKPVYWLLESLKKIAVMQTGQIQHYILYLFIYMLLLFLLSYLNVI